jgi:hypothetical protein
VRLIVKLLKDARSTPAVLILPFGLLQLPFDLGLQTLIFRQSQQEMYAFGLTLGHQLLTAEPRVGSYQDAHLRPHCPRAGRVPTLNKGAEGRFFSSPRGHVSSGAL